MGGASRVPVTSRSRRLCTVHVVEVRVLGPAEVVQHDAVIALTSQERVLLAALALGSPAATPSASLCDALWRAELPRRPDKALQTLVLRLRRTLGADVITTTGPGYALAPDVAVDAHAFEREVALAAGPDRTSDERVAILTRALERWRGSAYDDLDGWEPAQQTSFGLDELHRHAAEELAAARLSLGVSPDLIASLEGLVAAEPLRERRWKLLAGALANCGREGEALGAIARARAIMRSELKCEVGPDLAEIERRLRQAVASPPESVDRLHRLAAIATDDGDSKAAVGQLVDAIQVADRAGTDLRTRADLHIDLAANQARLGLMADAITSYRRAAGLARQSGDSSRLARCALGAASLGLTSGLDAHDPVADLLTEALEAVSIAPTAVRSELLSALAVAEAHNRPATVAHGHAREALSIGRVIGEPEVTFGALEAMVRTDGDPARLAARAALVEEMRSLAEAQERSDWTRRVLAHEARLIALRGDLMGAFALLEELETDALAADDLVCAHVGDLRLLLWATTWGDLSDAEEAIARIRRSADAALVDPAAAVLAEFGQRGFVRRLFAAEVETVDDAETHDHAETLDAPIWPLPTMRAIGIAGHAHTLADLGQHARAREVLGQLEVGSLASLPRDLYWMSMVWAVARACHAVGDEDRAVDMYGAAEPFQDLCIVESVFMFLGSMHHHLGLLASIFDPPRAAEHLEEALAVHTRLRSPHWMQQTNHALTQLRDDGRLGRPHTPVPHQRPRQDSNLRPAD